MAVLGSRRIHYALTASRGKGVLDLIKGLNSAEKFALRAVDGATLGELINVAADYLSKHPFDVIYVAGGACNITTKNSKTKRISYNWGRGAELQEHLVHELSSADTKLKKEFPASKVVFCPLIACDLSKVITEGSTTEEDQQVVEEAVWEFNSNVFKINKARGTVSPALHHQVHRFCKKKKRAYYHLTGYLKQKWAEEFVRVMAHN